MQRRDLLKGFVLGGAASELGRVAMASAAPLPAGGAARLAAVERRYGGRLGVAILDTGSGERFLMCSTFKLLLVSAMLASADRGEEKLSRRIVYHKDAVLEWAPVTRKHVGPPGMTIAQLCLAAITLSDNTAANLLLEQVGGPPAVTRYARGLGDTFTRLDRIEPALNWREGDKDTTTPDATLADMRKLLLGDALSRRSRGRLIHWLLACRTGADALRAGLPPDWQEGDKTGSGRTANNDIAILRPPLRKPLLVTAYYEKAHADVPAR
ncbi:MAG: class A beta-lactamase [Xanthomonadaceae bacterium]|nr:class A beta-lactamase [Xanthomonadaceae bacterium]